MRESGGDVRSRRALSVGDAAGRPHALVGGSGQEQTGQLGQRGVLDFFEQSAELRAACGNDARRHEGRRGEYDDVGPDEAVVDKQKLE